MFQVFLDMLCRGLLSSRDGVSPSESSVSMMNALTAVSMDIVTFVFLLSAFQLVEDRSCPCPQCTKHQGTRTYAFC